MNSLPPDEMSHRERESAERHHRDQYPASAGTPHHSNAGSLTIHQPVASRLPGAIHSPGGLLANHGSAPPIALGGNSAFGGNPESNRGHAHNAQSASSQMFGAIGGPSSGPAGTSAPPASSLFGGPLQQDAGRPSQTIPFGGATGGGAGASAGGGGHPMNNGPGALPQGQQPILNDALSYLDQVKVQFADQADVYNRFLDIMKDFKSQTIDTPGVINRVSELFAGHPNLIQGFNTFLPPGYRIECGANNDPNTIRVTTPMGTTVQSITGRIQGDTSHGPSGGISHRAANWQQQGPQQPSQPSQPQHSIESPEAAFSAPVASGTAMFGPNHAGQSTTYEAQRGTSLLGNSVPGPNPPIARGALTPTPGAQSASGSGAQNANMEKRGPVEFNHAISYVNKIKNRFQDKPEIYKQFLEILQTYQREQKPIQEVYAQVTSLFNTAPDLLEDFKQFLPEAGLSAKANNARQEDLQAAGNLAQSTPQPGQSARDGQKLPPVGSFAPPPSVSKESKKRARTDKQAPIPGPNLNDGSRSISGVQGGANGDKRRKLANKTLGPDTPTIDPTLTPVYPEPMPPTSTVQGTPEEFAYFDKIKKAINNKQTTLEFMKLLNMHTQNLVDVNDLVSKAYHFIGHAPELYNWFKGFMDYDGNDDMIENRPMPPSEKVSLSNCRAVGPSYRLLPRREKLKPCNGRDEMCLSVLNDEWASHPTWASEDSGFVAHRKNAFEEGLHRVEEERHDYDFNIEANIKCIQLLEPIAQQMLAMPEQDRNQFVMPPGLGGPSMSIYKRVLKKIYGTEKGAEIVNDMFDQPFAVVPVVLARLKQKDEEWRFSQREWEKVWQAQTEIMHLKSLDHLGIQVKGNDKRNLSAKHLVDVIKTKHEEQRRQRSAKTKVPRYQFAYELGDQAIMLDLLRLMVLYGTSNGHHNATEKERIVDFFESFIPQFFEMAEDKVQERLNDIDRESGEEDTEEIPTELPNGRTRRNGKKSDLLRGVLDPGRNGTKSRKEKEDSANSGSKETTPDVGSANEDEAGETAEDVLPSEVSNERWLSIVPRPTVLKGNNPLVNDDGELKADGFFPRPWYNFFCNQTIYVFFSVFQNLYKRLKELKGARESILDEIKRSKSKKQAIKLGINVTELNYFDEQDPESFWPKTMELIEDYITGEIDENRYQEVLRHYYLKQGWTLYTISDLMKTLCRLALTCTSTDSKEKTPDLINQFLSSRSSEQTSYQVEISARNYAQKCIKDGDMFVICWFPQKQEATVRWLQRDETTFYMDEMELVERWQYYISSYIRVEPTEGVSRAHLQKTVLTRNLPSSDADSDDGSALKPLRYEDNLALRTCLNTYKMEAQEGTAFWLVNPTEAATPEEKIRGRERAVAMREHRAQVFREKVVMNSKWMHDTSAHVVSKAKENFQKWVTDGVAPTSDERAEGGGGEAMEGVE